MKAEEALRVLRAEHKTEIEELKAKHEADIAASRDLFLVRTKPSRANGSGQARSFGKELKAIMLDAAGQGVASADMFYIGPSPWPPKFFSCVHRDSNPGPKAHQDRISPLSHNDGY